MLWLALAVVGPAASARAQEQFKPLDVSSLQDDAEKYHRMARNLRKRYQIREQKVSAIQQQVQQTIAAAQARRAQEEAEAQARVANAQSNASGMNAAAGILSLFPGGNSMLGNAIKNGIQSGLQNAANAQVAAANQDAANAAAQGSAEAQQAQEQANALAAQSDKEKAKLDMLSNRAAQLDRLGDAKSLLASAEQLRLKAETAAHSSSLQSEVDKARGFLLAVDLW